MALQGISKCLLQLCVQFTITFPRVGLSWFGKRLLSQPRRCLPANNDIRQCQVGVDFFSFLRIWYCGCGMDCPLTQQIMEQSRVQGLVIRNLTIRTVAASIQPVHVEQASPLFMDPFHCLICHAFTVAQRTMCLRFSHCQNGDRLDNNDDHVCQ